MADIKKVHFAVPGGKVYDKQDGREYKCTHIECSVWYSLGGVSFYDGHSYERGYYASVQPVELGNDGCVSYMLGSGTKFLLLGCSRQSPKREAEAVAKFDAEVKDYIAKVFGLEGIELAA